MSSPGFVAPVAPRVASLAHSRLKKLNLRRLDLRGKHYQQYDRRTCSITRSWSPESLRRYMATLGNYGQHFLIIIVVFDNYSRRFMGGIWLFWMIIVVLKEVVDLSTRN